MKKSANHTPSYELVEVVEAHRQVSITEKCLEHRRAWLRKVEKDEDCSESFVEARRKAVKDGERDLRAAKKKYLDLIREVHVFDKDGNLLRVEKDGSRRLSDEYHFESDYDADYEREAEAVAAALYENGVLDI